MVVHFLASDERLYPSHWIRSADETSVGHRVHVGGFDVNDIHVYPDWDDYRFSFIGLVTSRKSPAPVTK